MVTKIGRRWAALTSIEPFRVFDTHIEFFKTQGFSQNCLFTRRSLDFWKNLRSVVLLVQNRKAAILIRDGISGHIARILLDHEEDTITRILVYLPSFNMKCPSTLHCDAALEATLVNGLCSRQNESVDVGSVKRNLEVSTDRSNSD
jgi:hypothetical protein